MKLWEPFKIERGKDYFWKIGPLKIWLKRIEDEWIIASEQTTDNLEDKDIVISKMSKKSEPSDWSRFIYAGSDIVQLLPGLPDRAVVMGSEMVVKILQENSALFFVSVPVWIRVYVGEKKDKILTEIPTELLSNTWFGDPMTGELCYSLITKARRSIEESESGFHRAICPVKIFNKSSNTFDFQKFSIHVEHLKIYSGKKVLWTNEVEITYLGEDQPSKIEFSKKKPVIEKDCVLLSEERTPVDQSLIKKSVSFLKDFTSIEP